jgi:hypothetical protein
MHPRAVISLKPIKILFDARPRQIIEDHNLLAVRKEAVGEIAADEAAASGDGDRARLASDRRRRNSAVGCGLS